MINQIFKVPTIKLLQLCVLLTSVFFFSACQKEKINEIYEANTVEIRADDDKTPMEGTLQLKVRVFLDGPYDPSLGSMDNSLGAGNLIPGITDPDVAGQFVDWVDIELRSQLDPEDILETKTFLVTPNGWVANLDGTIILTFDEPSNEAYYVAVRHRNHLGCMTAEALYFRDQTIGCIDFTSMATQTWTSATNQFPRKMEADEVMTLWAGDATADDAVIQQGPGNDNAAIIFAVTGNPGNPTGDINFIVSGVYATEDTNMDGNIIAQGPGHDRQEVFLTVFTYPGNTSNSPNFVVTEILP